MEHPSGTHVVAAISCLIASLSALAQAPPTINVVRDTQDEVTLAAAGTSQRLPFATVVSIPFGPDTEFRFATERGKPLTVRARDLVAGDTWHVVQDLQSEAVFLWASAGHSTTLPTTATIITAEAAACSPAQMFRLAKIITVRARVLMTLLSTNEVTRCRWMVFGLRPGEYDASLHGPDGSSGRRDFRIVEGKPTDVTIAPPAVTVTGVVTINGKPITNGVMQFRRDFGAWTIIIDEVGSYRFNTDDEGDYSLTMLRPFSRFKPFIVTFARGPNVFDWNIDDPSADSQVTVHVTGNDLTDDTEIDVEADGKRLESSYIPRGKDTVTRMGLPFGKYRVVARQPGGTSEWREVELMPSAPAAAIKLTIERASRSITLRYADGEPVTSAGFGFTPRPEEKVPGTYSLASIPAQTELVIWPPLGTRLCRVVPESGHLDATVSPGRSVTLRFQNRRISIDEVRISTESDCPIPLGMFLKSPLRVGPHTADVEVLNAPPDEILTIHTRDGSYRATVGADGSILIPSKQ
jgi:hypothetical protein